MEKKGKKMQIDLNDRMGDIISRSEKAASKGISPKTKRTQKSVMDILGDDTLEIVEAPVVEKKAKSIMCKWKDVRGTKTYMDVPASEWTNKKFFGYMKWRFGLKDKSLRMSIDGCVGFARQAAFIIRIREEFLAKLGNPITNEMLKDYIDWFVDTELDAMISNSNFSVWTICNKKNIHRFIKDNSNKQVVEEERVDFSNIEDSFNSGGVNFLLNYGLVVPYIWLHKNKNLSSSEAKEAVIRFFRDSMKSGEAVATKICDITVRLSPYSPSYYDKDLEEILKACNVKGISFTNKNCMYVKENR